MVRRVVHRQKERDAYYRAIGRYFVQFSDLIAYMRTLVMLKIVSRDEGAETLLRLTLGSMQAQQVADAFFAVCRTAAEPELSKPELLIEKCLREAHVNAEIRWRNVLAHGDWFVPEWVQEWRPENADPTALPPLDMKASLFRVQHHKPSPLDPHELTPEQIDQYGERVEQLGHMAWEFGTICLRAEHHEAGRPGRTVRIKDAFELTGSANERQVQFRDGYWERFGVAVR